MALHYMVRKRTFDDSAGVATIAVVTQENVAVDYRHKTSSGSAIISRASSFADSRTVSAAVVDVGPIITITIAKPCGRVRMLHYPSTRIRVRFELVTYSGGGWDFHRNHR